jgi:hypothetical protein
MKSAKGRALGAVIRGTEMMKNIIISLQILQFAFAVSAHAQTVSLQAAAERVEAARLKSQLIEAGNWSKTYESRVAWAEATDEYVDALMVQSVVEDAAKFTKEKLIPYIVIRTNGQPYEEQMVQLWKCVKAQMLYLYPTKTEWQKYFRDTVLDTLMEAGIVR